MPKFVRRQPLLERIKSRLNPLDFQLWLSEVLESLGWDEIEKIWALPTAVLLNLIFIVSRANASAKSEGYDDVFGDPRGPGWFARLMNLNVYILTLISFANAIHTFLKKKHYRLFENSIDNVPSTPSAHRVRVDSSPVASSPLRFLSNILRTETAASRAHPDPVNDVWELAIWDPSPISVRLFCYFSPGHVILYWLFLPTLPSDPRPSTTVVTALFLALLLSIQMSLLSINFSRQSKDAALISKEVLHEYDTKYVRPRTQPLYRDVSTQFSEQASYSERREEKYNSVDTYRPTVIINRGFQTHANPNYVSHVNPDGQTAVQVIPRSTSAVALRTPASNGEFSSPMKPVTAIRQPVFRPSAGHNDGGSLGVHTHAASPVRRGNTSNFSPMKMTNASEAARERSLFSPERRSRLSAPSDGISTAAATQRWGHLKSDRQRRESGRL